MTYLNSDLLAYFRGDVQDNATPPFWSDDTFYQYLDDAVRQFYRLTEGIEDGRTLLDAKGTPLTQILVVPTQEWYTTSSLVLKIRTAYRTDTGLPVGTAFPENLEDLNIRFDGKAGPVSKIIQGISKNQVRIWPVPNETVTLQLSVYRLPIVTITSDVDGATPEIDDQHALNMMLWVKHRAYGVQDQDTYDKKKSIDFKAQFESYCAMAKREQIRARHTPGNVTYGGLPIGSSGYFPRANNDYYNRR